MSPDMKQRKLNEVILLILTHNFHFFKITLWILVNAYSGLLIVGGGQIFCILPQGEIDKIPVGEGSLFKVFL